MNRLSYAYLFVIGALMVLPASCSVLEDRKECPCYLDVDYRYILQGGHGADPAGFVRVELFSPGLELSGEQSLDECPSTAEYRVSRNQTKVVAVVSPSDSLPWTSDGTRIVYAPGNQADSLYLHVSEVDCSGEEAYCLLTPVKQFSTLFITDNQGGSLLRNWNLVIRGSSCGLDVRDGVAVAGEYLYTVQDADASGWFRVRIPRQIDDRLVLEIYDRDLYHRLYTVPIGRTMTVLTKADPLPDYEVRVDFASMLAYVRLADWTEVGMTAIFR